MEFMPGQGPQPTVEEYLTTIYPRMAAAAPPSAPAAGPVPLSPEERERRDRERRAALADAKSLPARFAAAMRAAGLPGAVLVYRRSDRWTLLRRVKCFANVGYGFPLNRDEPDFRAWPLFERRRFGDGHRTPSSWTAQVMLTADGGFVEAPTRSHVSDEIEWLHNASAFWSPLPGQRLHLDAGPESDDEWLRARAALTETARRHGVALD
jgi:hypothetical protein